MSSPASCTLTGRQNLYAYNTYNGFTKSVFFKKPVNAFFRCNYYRCRVMASMSMRNEQRPNNDSVCGYFIFDAIRNGFKFSTLFVTPPSFSFSIGAAAADIPHECFPSDEHNRHIVSSSDKNFVDAKTLKLVSGSCYLPHPEKEETGGEDAHFICIDEHAVGVADGVGGWADVGINSGEFSRELMLNSVHAIQDEPLGFIDPARILEKAHSCTKANGSSTACIIALTKEGIEAINLGDSGFIIVRDGCTVFRSPVQQHSFNFTYQLERGNTGDLPSSGQVFTVAVAPGDVLVAGTDGLFDNLYNHDISAIVVHELSRGSKPTVTARTLADMARRRAEDRSCKTPFSMAAQAAGFHYQGGKLDDITVVVSYVTILSSDME